MSRNKYYKQEKVFKGVANHRRLEILDLLFHEPNLSLDDIVKNLRINYQTGSEHVQRLTRAGLVYKQKQGNEMLHRLSPLGESIYKSITKLLLIP